MVKNKMAEPKLRLFDYTGVVDFVNSNMKDSFDRFILGDFRNTSLRRFLPLELNVSKGVIAPLSLYSEDPCEDSNIRKVGNVYVKAVENGDNCAWKPAYFETLICYFGESIALKNNHRIPMGTKVEVSAYSTDGVCIEEPNRRDIRVDGLGVENYDLSDVLPTSLFIQEGSF